MNGVVARVLALVVAVGMVLGAVALRDRMTTATPDVAASPGPGEGPADPSEDETPNQVVCAADLHDVCEALHAATGAELGIRYEDARTTADRLVASDRPDLDAWLVLDPWPAVVDEARQRAGREPLFTGRVTRLASSPLVIVVDAPRAAVLEARCGAITWSCVGDLAGGTWAAAGGEEAWGAPKPGHAAPTAASGLLLTGQVAASRLGTTGFSTRDLADDAFRGWFTTLERAVPTFTPSAGSHLRQLLQFGPSTVDVVGTLEAEVAELLPRVGSRADQVRVVHADPLLVADLVVADLDGSVAGAFDGLTDALASEGWRTSAAPPSAFPGWPTLPEPAQALPNAGALEALASTWAEVVR